MRNLISTMTTRITNNNNTFDLEHNPQRPNRLDGLLHFSKMALVASLAAGIQFGWALQLSLLTPYVQLLGIPHKLVAFVWLCGPISGMLVQPFVGYHSDRCRSRFGRRRPFIAAGAVCVIIAVILIGFAADIGHKYGDSLEKGVKRSRAIAVFVVGFWILDVANNMLQGPCRAFLADLAAKDQKRTRIGNTCYSFFMAVGNVLGYLAGAYKDLYTMLPFTKTKACDVYCANLKSCFLISIVLILVLTTIALSFVHDTPLSEIEQEMDHEPCEDGQEKGKSAEPFFTEIISALNKLNRPMWILLLVTSLNWIAWFPFLLFDTDWMGHEVYGGEVGEMMYDLGVRIGSLGLMVNSIVLGVMALSTEYVGTNFLGGARNLWGAVNLLLAVCMAMTVLVTKMAESHRRYDAFGMLLSPPSGIKAGALSLFAVLGIPLAVTYSVPFAMASIFSNDTGAGQGLSLGVLNLSIVIPQMLVSLVSGPWDDLFGGGNLPAFVVGAVAAAASGVLALTILPSPPPNATPSTPENCGVQ